ncbi:MAG TPA: homoprotocatechuate degradation operon regulator HpaR [Castellaniella sp.]|nr:homoprotocatechuate degradation operon regulator HpaR [Castellaniella sp.]
MKTPLSHRNLPHMLLRGREALLCHFRPILNHFDLTEQQWRIIRNLNQYGDMEPNQLCELCQILSPSMTGVLARMKAADLIHRRKVARDQRRVIISLTLRSQEICARIAPLIEEQYRLIEDAIGHDLLDRTYAHIDELLAAPLDRIQSVKLPD